MAGDALELGLGLGDSHQKDYTVDRLDIVVDCRDVAVGQELEPERGRDTDIPEVVDDAAVLADFDFVVDLAHSFHLPGDAHRLDPVVRFADVTGEKYAPLDGVDGDAPEQLVALVEQPVLDLKCDGYVVDRRTETALLSEGHTRRGDAANDKRRAPRQGKKAAQGKDRKGEAVSWRRLGHGTCSLPRGGARAAAGKAARCRREAPS